MGVFTDQTDDLDQAFRDEMAKIQDDFKQGVGTYLKVVRFFECSNPPVRSVIWEGAPRDVPLSRIKIRFGERPIRRNSSVACG